MARKNQASGGAFLVGAVVGTLVGAGLGLLLAPAGGGKEVRRRIKKAGKAVAKQGNAIRKNVEEAVSPVLDDLEDIGDTLSKDIKKAQKKLEPVVEGAIDSAAKTQKIIDKTLKKTKRRFFKGI